MNDNFESALIKEAHEYNFKKEHIEKSRISSYVTGEAEVQKAYFADGDLYLHLDTVYAADVEDEYTLSDYYNCVLVIHNGVLAPVTTKDLMPDIDEKKLQQINKHISRRSLYMSFREFLLDGCAFATITFKDGKLNLWGYGKYDDFSSMWADFTFDFQDISLYYDTCE